MKKLAVSVAILILIGCATSSESKNDMNASVTDFPSLVKEANASIKKAKSVGGEWRDSSKYVKKAEKANKAGDTEKAIKLVRKAIAQGKMGYTQALAQKDAGPWLF